MLKISLVACLLLAMLCVPALAQDEVASNVKGLSVSLSTLRFSDSDMRDVFGNTLGVVVEQELKGSANSPLYVSLGYYKASASATDGVTSIDLDISVMPLMLTKRFEKQAGEGSTRTAYYGVGAGIIFSNLDLSAEDIYGNFGSASGSQTDFGWQLLAGMKFNEKMFAEAKYLNGGDIINTGFSLSAGARF